MSGAPTSRCIVCGDPITDSNSALCNTCGNPFHLRLRNDTEGRDCGEVWINEQFLALEFACFTCLRGETTAAGGEPPVGRGH
jgi:predicted amidophosphoribosyltransferase